MIEATDKIPVQKFGQWHNILIQTGGRYLNNPYVANDYVFVTYTPGDYEQQAYLWKQVNTNIRETRRSKFKHWVNKFKRFWCKRLY